MAYTDIDKSDDYFNTVLYTGNGGTNNITGVNFQPDLVWIKDRTVGFDHVLQDSVRGTTKIINSNQTYVEFTNTGSITSFDSDGWTTGSYVATNLNSTPFVAWNWLAANGTASNTDGSITSTVSANTTSGFSIVSYTGDGGSSSTVGHGLGAIPKMVIIKCRTSTPSWQVWGEGYTRLSLNNPDGDLASYGMTRGASTVTLPNGINDWNGSGSDYIMYCWSEVKAFSKFGQYTGNGSTNGTFVYTGFKTAWVMVKRINSTGSWRMWDNKREGYNGDNAFVYANSSSTEEADGTVIDLLSNGFKFRNSSGDNNASGSTYIYMAFAENPFVTSTGIPGLAR